MLKRRVAKFKISPNQGVLGLSRIGNRWGFRIAMPRKSATRNRLLALAILVAVALPISQYLIRSSSAADLPVNIGPYAQSVSAGGDHTCAIFNDDGLLYCWGDNTYGQLGIGSNVDQTTPVSVMPYLPSGAKVKQVSAGLQHTCAVVEIGTDNTVYCWGKNDNGQLGNGITLPVTTANSQNSNVPVQVPGGSFTPPQKVSAGFAHTCAVYGNGDAYCWGNNDEGQLGDGSGTFSGGQWTVKPTSSSTPILAAADQNMDIAAGATHTCTMRTPATGQLWCWGGNGSSQFGNNSTTSSSHPTYVSGITGLASVSSGFFNSCGIFSGEVRCWGDNTSGQIGNNTTTMAASPLTVGGLLAGRTATNLTSGYAHTCAVADGALFCWGDDTSGQVAHNDTTYTNNLTPTAVTLNNNNGVSQTLSAVSSAGGNVIAKSVSGGFSHTCAIYGDSGGHSYDTLLCGGLNDDGELGVGTTNVSPALIAVDISMVPNNLLPTPTITNVTPNRGPVAGGTNVDITGTNFGPGEQWKQISAGRFHTCAITSNDQAYCWGNNQFGQLGNNSTTDSPVPVAVDTSGVLSGLTIKQISAGRFHTCAITSNDQAYCWGNNQFGQLGNNSTTDSPVPVAVDTSGVLSGLTIKQISVGSGNDFYSGHFHTCAIASNDQAYCWGNNGEGQLGNGLSGSANNSPVPVAVDTSGVLSGLTIKQISVGGLHTCAITSNDQAYCWGNNIYDQLGNPSVTYPGSSIPVAIHTSGVLSGLTIKQISAGATHTCAIASDNQAYCWGNNQFGQLGNNSTTDSPVPVAVDTSGALNGLAIKQISAGSSHTCAIASNDQTYCWGDNSQGQLGNPNVTNLGIPVPVAIHTSGILNGLTIKQISAIGVHTCAIASDDQAYCWGNNYNGQLGNDSTTDRPVPARVGSPYIISSVTFGGTPVNSFAVTSPTSITAVTPPHAAGPVDVVITTTDGQTVTYPNGFTYYEVPAAPVLNSLTPGTDQTTLSWTAPVYDGYSPITGYKIEMCVSGGMGCTVLVADTGNTNTSYTYTIPDDTVSYSFQVSAINEAGAGPASNVLSTQPSFIDLSVDTNLVGINVTPSTTSGVVSNAKHTVSFTTNKSHGVSLSLSTNTNHNNLVNTMDSSRTIAAGGGSMTSPTTLAVNTWGFAIANSNTNISNGFDSSYGTESNNSSSTSKWAMVPTLSSPLTIKSTSVANPLISNNTDVWYGVRIDASTPAGTYNTTVLYTAVGNIAP